MRPRVNHLRVSRVLLLGGRKPPRNYKTDQTGHTGLIGPPRAGSVPSGRGRIRCALRGQARHSRAQGAAV